MERESDTCMSNCFQSPERCRRRSSNRWLSTKKRRKRKERKETFCLPFQLFLSYLRFSLAVETSSTIGLCVSTLWVAFFPICRIRHVEPNHQVRNDRKVNVSHNHLNLVGLRGLLVLLLLSSWSSSVLMYDGESPLSIEIAVSVCVCVLGIHEIRGISLEWIGEVVGNRGCAVCC